MKTSECLTPLHQLSAWATQGIWRTGFAHWGRIQICGPDRTIGELNAYVGLGGAENALNAEQENNGAFICALVNAYRSGALVARSETKQINAAPAALDGPVIAGAPSQEGVRPGDVAGAAPVASSAGVASEEARELIAKLRDEGNSIKSVHMIRGADLGVWYALMRRAAEFIERSTPASATAPMGLGGAENALNAEQENNGAFICALVNAYRSGALVARSESASSEIEALNALFPMLWHINDHLKVTPDQRVEYEGSTNDVDDFRAALHRLDPEFKRGVVKAAPEYY